MGFSYRSLVVYVYMEFLSLFSGVQSDSRRCAIVWWRVVTCGLATWCASASSVALVVEKWGGKMEDEYQAETLEWSVGRMWVSYPIHVTCRTVSDLPRLSLAGNGVGGSFLYLASASYAVGSVSRTGFL